MPPEPSLQHSLNEHSAGVQVVAHWLCSFDNDTAKSIMPNPPTINFNLRRDIYEDRALRLVQCLVEGGYVTLTDLGANAWNPS